MVTPPGTRVLGELDLVRVCDPVMAEGAAPEWHHSSYLALRPILLILLERVKRPGLMVVNFGRSTYV